MHRITIVWSWTGRVGEGRKVVKSVFRSLGEFAGSNAIASPTTEQPETSVTDVLIFDEGSLVAIVIEDNDRWLPFEGISASVDTRC